MIIYEIRHMGTYMDMTSNHMSETDGMSHHIREPSYCLCEVMLSTLLIILITQSPALSYHLVIPPCHTARFFYAVLPYLEFWSQTHTRNQS